MYASLKFSQQWCGDWVVALCDYGGGHHSSSGGGANDTTGCSPQYEDNNNNDNDNEGEGGGEYDVVFPEPHVAYNDDSQHKVRVRSAVDHRNWGCSEAFSLLPSEDAPQHGGGGGEVLDGGPFLEVTSPTANDTAIVGEEYTVEASNRLLSE